MTGLLQLPRVWLAVAALSAASIAGGVTAVIAEHNSGSSTKVLGEKVTGSGSSTAGPNAAGGNGGQGNNGNGNGNSGSPGHAFTISGSATGLFPGVEKELHLTVTNPNNQAMTVTGLTARLQSVSGAPGCAASTANLTIASYTGPGFDVQQNASSVSPGYIGLTLPSSVANACQGATYNLSYSGTAVKK